MAGSLPYPPAPPDHLNLQTTMERPRPEYGYPSPTQMAVASSYSYPPQQQQPSPHLPPLNLPPIRLDSQPQPQQQQPGPPPMGSPLPPPPHGMPPQYYAHPPPNMAGQVPMNSMRYQLPPQQGDHQRVLSGGRHKKEIKRRTKTGCLTCRKRRIKCDEAHPSCRNCAKSKRDCLGYDPIFKPQPGPAQIQPAPNSTSHQTSSPGPPPPTTAPYSAQVPQGYAPAATAGYPPPPPASASAHAQHDSFNSAAIDPALAATDPAMHGQPSYNGVHALNPALRGSPYSPAAPDAQPVRGKPLDISEIFPIAHHNPPEVPQRPAPIPPELDDEFAAIFTKDYCAGLDVMLETKWFSTNNNALNRFFANRALHEEAIFFTETVKYRNTTQDMSGVFSQEARLIWHMLGSCKQPDPAMNGTNGISPEHDDLALKEVRARFDILEALLTNQNLESNPLRQLSYPTELPDMKRTELEFWEQLGEFVQTESHSAPPGAADYALGRMRSVLNAQEVRDALYSVAIARHVGNRIRGFPNALPANVDQHPESELTKLTVAMSFISHECRSGTQQVIARICDMAMLSWTVSRSS